MSLPPIISTYSYATMCGPTAFAAITGSSRMDAAGRLRRITKHLGWPLNGSTFPGVLELGFAELGIEIEVCCVRSGVRLGRVDLITPEEVEALVGERPRHVEYSAHSRPVAAPVGDTPRATHRSTLRVCDWLERFTAGTFVLHVANHVLAQRDGVLIAGDDGGRWDHTPLSAAWRVAPT